MFSQRNFRFTSISLLTQLLQPALTYIGSSSFFPVSLICDKSLVQYGNEDESLDLVYAASRCMVPWDDSNCIGVQCNSSGSNCEMIRGSKSDCIHCVDNPIKDQEHILLRRELIQREQEEFLLIELNHGQFSSGSVPDVPAIHFPINIRTRLHTQFGSDILACSEDDGTCWLLTGSSNSWHPFPSLAKGHELGAMSLIGDKPIVVGGRHPQHKTDNGYVEIFDKETFQWIRGPTLDPVRIGPALVPLNESSLVVVGGMAMIPLNSVKILDLQSQTWNQLDNYPKPIYVTICGAINSTYILCIGGGQSSSVFNTAFGLDLSLDDFKWQRQPFYDIEVPIAAGFILHFHEYLYCLSSYTTSFEKSRTLRRMNLIKPNSKWEVLKVFPDDFFHFMFPYFIKGYTIEPKSVRKILPTL